MKSTTAKYGTVAVAIHWLSAILIFAMLGSGFRAASTVDAEAKASILTVHATFGVMILVLTLARAAWWMFADRKPDQPAGGPRPLLRGDTRDGCERDRDDGPFGRRRFVSPTV